MTADEIAAAIRALPLTATNLVKIIAAAEAFCDDCNISGYTGEVWVHLHEALGAAGNVRAYGAEGA